MATNEELCTILNNVLDFRFPKDGRDFIGEKNILVLEENIKFFRDIPKENLECVFINSILTIENYVINMENHLLPKLLKLKKSPNNTKPSILIKQDLNKLRDTLEVFERLSGVLKIYKKSHTVRFETITDEFKEPYKFIQELIKDYEKGSNFSYKHRYDAHVTGISSKLSLKIFFQALRDEYNLKNVSLEQKNIIDNITHT